MNDYDIVTKTSQRITNSSRNGPEDTTVLNAASAPARCPEARVVDLASPENTTRGEPVRLHARTGNSLQDNPN